MNAPAATPSTLPWTELGRLLSRLAQVPGDPVHLRPGADVALTIELMASSLGLRATPISGSFQLLRHVLENGGILVCPPSARTDPAVVLSETDRRGRVRVHLVPLDEVGRWCTEADLKRLLGPEALAGRTWFSCRAAEPLQAARAKADRVPPRPGSRLWALAAMERQDLFVIAVFAAVVGLLSLATPVAVQSLVNTIAFGTLTQPVVVVSVILLAVLALSGAMSVAEAYVAEMLERRLFLRAAEDVSERLPRALAGSKRRTSPELLNRFFDVFALQKAANALLLDGLDVALKLLVGLLLLAFYHPLLLVFDLILVLGLGMLLWLGRNGPERARMQSKAKYRFVAWLESVAGAPLTFRMPAGRRLALEVSESRAIDYLQARESYFRVVLRQKIGLVTLQALAGAGLLGLGGFLVLQGRLTLGELVAAELVLATMVSAFAKLDKQLTAFYDAWASADKVGQLLDFEVEPRHRSLRLPTDRSALSVSLRAVTIDRDIHGSGLGIPHLEIPAGAFVTLEDRDGGAAEALMESISGLNPSFQGQIELDGQDVRDLEPSALAGAVLLLRGAEVFDGTVLDHLSLRDDSVDATLLGTVLTQLGLNAMLDRLPDRLQTSAAVLPGSLTDAERILLSIARLVFMRPQVVLIDGALDRLPARARTLAIACLRRHLPGRTVVVHSELPEVLAVGDWRIVIQDGLAHVETGGSDD